MNRYSRLLLGLAISADLAVARPEPTAVSDTPASHPVVVELFTSQGCSSCPPADRLLGKLGEEQPGRVIPLAFHVDYWNHDGWYDPFSSRRWSERQAAYARKFNLNGPYTPEAVIGGSREMIGSREALVRAAIASDAARPSAELAVRLLPDGDKLRVDVDVERPDALRERKLEVMVAVYETGLVTAVAHGENRGRTLRDEDVVRLLARAGKLPAGGPARASASSELTLEKDWNRARLGVAAFLQDPHSLEICGASAVSLPGTGGEAR